MHTLAQMIADQAAAAIDNLKMLQDALTAKNDAAKLVEELEVILEAFRDSFAQPDETSTLETIADQLQRLIPHDSCLIYTVQDGTDELIPRVVRDPNPRRSEPTVPARVSACGARWSATGVRRKIDDVRNDPDFEPVPGIDLEPEAMLVVPMIRKGTIFGVISLSRLDRRVFTDHELRILAVFCSHASLSLQVARMQASEHAQAARGAGARRAACGARQRAGRRGDARRDRTLRAGPARRELGRAALPARAGARSQPVLIEIDAPHAAELLDDIDPELEACLARRACRVLARPGRFAAAVPLEAGAEVLGMAVFVAPVGTQWDQSLVDTFAHQSSLGLRNAHRARTRAPGAPPADDLLSTLGTELAQAKSRRRESRAVLGKSARHLRLGAQHPGPARSLVATRSRCTSARAGGTRELSVKLAGRGRFASARLSSEAAPEDSVFAAWAQDVSHELSRQLGVVSYIAAPLRTPSGVLGGLFVASRTTRHALLRRPGTAPRSRGRGGGASLGQSAGPRGDRPLAAPPTRRAPGDWRGWPSRSLG